jgi:hypothetical protein
MFAPWSCTGTSGVKRVSVVRTLAPRAVSRMLAARATEVIVEGGATRFHISKLLSLSVFITAGPMIKLFALSLSPPYLSDWPVG